MMKKKIGVPFKFQAWHLGAAISIFFLFANVFHIRDLTTNEKSYSTGLLGSFEKAFFDYRMRSRGTRPMSDKVGLLAVDEKSIAKFGRWPFSRSSYSDALKNLKNAGVKWIGFDAIFSEPENISLNDALEPMQDVLQNSLSPSGVLDPKRFVLGITTLIKSNPADQSFGKAISDFTNIVQGYALLPADQAQSLERDWSEGRKALQKNVLEFIEVPSELNSANQNESYPLINTPTIAGQSPIIGFLNNHQDSDGLMRRYQLIEVAGTSQGQVKFVPSFGLQIAAQYLNRKIKLQLGHRSNRVVLFDQTGDEISIPLDSRDYTTLINHYGEHTLSDGRVTPTIISLADASENILPKRVPEVLVFGSTAVGADDKRPSPLNAYANGPEHHIAVIENILRQDFLHRPWYFYIFELAGLAIGGALLCLLLSKASAVSSLIIVIATHGTLEFVDRVYLFGKNYIFNLGVFHLQSAFIFIAMMLFKYFIEEREKREIKGAFQHYLNPSVINQLLESPGGLKLGGEKRELTVFFSDVRGFTSISEVLSPEALANLLNEYFTPMTNIVLNSGGLLDKYIGDALMAVWGAPLPINDHADRALDSALKMLDALDHLREGWKTRSLPTIDIGCGINTGPMVVGNMGSNQRFDYTVLGDAVNLGSRLEGITKEYGVRIICSDTTRKDLKNPDRFVLRELDWIKVKGKNEPVTIFEVMRFNPEEIEKTKKIKDLFESGLGKYRTREFEAAQASFIQILQIAPNDGPASIFLERCEHYINDPVHPEWDGIWVMKSK